MFRDVLDLVPQSTVKVNDVTVGKVTAIELEGYIAQVTVELPRDVDLPDNATAQIRQTSLLGEKFVSLAPADDARSGKLGDGDTIGLDHTGRNPEVEEVLGALSLLLNGGGVGQLKTIVTELEQRLRRPRDRGPLGRSTRSAASSASSTRTSSRSSTALENINRLAGELRKQDGTIKATLDDVPPALRLGQPPARRPGQAAAGADPPQRRRRPGDQAVQGVHDQQPPRPRTGARRLRQGRQSFPKSFQVFLTYPFVDEAVGRDPQVARNLHMGDFTNLSINLTLDLRPDPACRADPGPSQSRPAVQQAGRTGSATREHARQRDPRQAIRRRARRSSQRHQLQRSAVSVAELHRQRRRRPGATVAAASPAGGRPSAACCRPDRAAHGPAGAGLGGVSVRPRLAAQPARTGYRVPARSTRSTWQATAWTPGSARCCCRGWHAAMITSRPRSSCSSSC